MVNKQNPDWNIRILEKPEEMEAAEELQRLVWPGSETDVVPLHVLVTVAHNGGVVIGAYLRDMPALEPHTRRSLRRSTRVPYRLRIRFSWPVLYSRWTSPQALLPTACRTPELPEPGFRFPSQASAMADGQAPGVGPDHLDL
jgi:hypothetical protein